MCFGVFCRIVFPPVYPIGGSDLFPGPGAGMYPTRYFSFTNLCWSLPTFPIVTFLILYIFKNFCRLSSGVVLDLVGVCF
jgi:hypothetical protein